jgi:hypothetical protein
MMGIRRFFGWLIYKEMAPGGGALDAHNNTARAVLR